MGSVWVFLSDLVYCVQMPKQIGSFCIQVSPQSKATLYYIGVWIYPQKVRLPPRCDVRKFLAGPSFATKVLNSDRICHK